MSTKPDTETGYKREWPAERGFYWTRDSPDDTNVLLVEVNRNRLTICGDDRHRNVNEAFVDSEFLGPVSPSDFEQLIQLRAWKESAMDLLSRYDSIAETFGGKLGSSKIDNLDRGVGRLRKALQEIADQDTLCTCEHDTEFCCARVGHYCAFCIAATALREALAHKEGEL